MTRLLRLALVPASSVVAAVAIAIGVVPVVEGLADDAAHRPAGCSEDVAPIAESAEFTPFAHRRSQTSTVQLGRMLLGHASEVDAGRASDLAPAEVAGERLTSVVGSDSQMVTATFGADAWQALEETQDLAAFYAAGGLILETIPAQSPKPQPSRTSAVEIGDATGLLSWADPINDAGLRPHIVQWTSGGRHLRLVADTSAEELVLAARALECRA